jgi:hypothetical protein
VRPTWGSQFWTVRYARRRADELQRALSARLAVREADDDDAAELEALERFKASLPPPPSRWLTVLALISAILTAQALLNLWG